MSEFIHFEIYLGGVQCSTNSWVHEGKMDCDGGGRRSMRPPPRTDVVRLAWNADESSLLFRYAFSFLREDA